MIAAAMDAASAGDTIEVRSGMYVENVDVYKQLTLIGEGADVVTVQAADAGNHVFNVTADYVNISGFTTMGATSYVDGVYLSYADYCNISWNNVSDNHRGIGIDYSSNNILKNNTAANNDYYGISLHDSSNNILTGNMMVNDGITISGTHLQHWNTHMYIY